MPTVPSEAGPPAVTQIAKSESTLLERRLEPYWPGRLDRLSSRISADLLTALYCPRMCGQKRLSVSDFDSIRIAMSIAGAPAVPP